MSGLGQRLGSAAPAVVLFTVIAGSGQLIAAVAGFSPVPAGYQVALGLLTAALLAVAAAPFVRAAYIAMITAGPPDRNPSSGSTGRDAAGVAASRGPAVPTRAAPAGFDGAGRTPDPTEAAAFGSGAATTRTQTLEQQSAVSGPTRPAAPTSPAAPASAAVAARRRSRHRRPLDGLRTDWPRPSITRILIVTAAVVLLALVCWMRVGEPSRVLFAVARTFVGLLAYALPILPALALVRLARPAREPVPWDRLLRGRPNRADLLHIARTAAAAAREKAFARPAGAVLATVALFHLLRGSPGLGEGAYRQAGGLLGMAIAAPVSLLLSRASAIGLLIAVLVCAALVTTGHLYRYAGRYPAFAALAVLVAAPLATTTATHFIGYDHYLGVRGDRLVVAAGLSAHHHHEVHDAGVALAEVPTALHPVLRDGVRVADRRDGLRVAAALARPATAAADSFPDATLPLKAGQCFSWVGGASGFRYETPCDGEHTGEVFYIGRLPFTLDPGRRVREVTARAMCEKAYGEYLGVPYGGSYIAMEPPVVQDDRDRALVACWFGSVGPWSLKDTRIVASLLQKVSWDPPPGCRAESADGLRLVVEQPNVRCLAPGRAGSVGGSAPVHIDAEFAAVGRAAVNARVGVACVEADGGTGYYVTVGGDGVLELAKQLGTERIRLATGGRPRTSPAPQTAATALQVVCRPSAPGTVEIVATAGRNRQLRFVDKDRAITRWSPRLVVESADAPVTANVTLFSAVLPR